MAFASSSNPFSATSGLGNGRSSLNFMFPRPVISGERFPAGLGVSMSLRDVFFRDAAANPGPCDTELGLAVVKVRAGPPSDAEGRLAVYVAFPPPLLRIHRRPRTFPAPPAPQTHPAHLI